MDGAKRLQIFFLVLVLLLIATALYWTNSGRQRYSWYENYRPDNRDPYGAYIAHELLRNYTHNKALHDLDKRVAVALPKTADTTGNANYVFVGEAAYFDSADVQRLSRFMEAGNRVFVSSQVIPFSLLRQVHDTLCNAFMLNRLRYDKNYDTLVNLNLTHPQLQRKKGWAFERIDQFKRVGYEWSYFSDTATNCTEIDQRIITLGTLDTEYVNFVKINFGKGQLLLHTTPLVFANITLLDSQRLQYAEKVWSHLHQSGDVYWDTKSQVAQSVAENLNNPDRHGNNLSTDSPLRYILSQPALTWAWYLFLASVALYFFFAAKRRQRIIEVLKPKRNASLAFLRTIGSMYFARGNHAAIGAMQFRDFQQFARERYRLQGREWNDEQLATLAQRSGIQAADIDAIMQADTLLQNEMTDKALEKLYLRLQDFYKRCK